MKFENHRDAADKAEPPEPSELDKLRAFAANISDQLASAKRDQDIALQEREAMKRENERMRESIKEAHGVFNDLLMCYFVPDHSVYERLRKALNKLDPFLP